MNPDFAPPAYTREQRRVVTFAEVATKIFESGDSAEVLEDALEAFRRFLASQENVTLSKNQLQVLKAQGVLVLEEAAKYLKSGGDGSDIVPKLASIFLTASESLQSQTKWDVVLKEQDGPSHLDSIISHAFEGLEQQLRGLLKGSDSESTAGKEDLKKAREEDQRNITELAAIVQRAPPQGSSWTSLVQESMDRELKASYGLDLRIIGDRTVTQPTQEPQTEAKRSLAILTELTGTSLPPSTLLGRDFVTIGNRAIHQGSSYDVFLGEYFTGEQIAIKVLRHRVDKETGQRMHHRFARQTVNWSSLRHDAILPFYGIGLVNSSVVPGEFQLYLVSPYIQNRDAKTYLKKYPKAPPHARLQMVALDVARGLYHMHDAVELGEAGHGIVHSALNVYNVLIKDSGRAVISGFGHAKIIKDFQESFTGDNSEYRYMGPELMQDEARITYGTDIYAWAMTSLEILSDVPPFGTTKGPSIIQKVAAGQTPNRSEHPKIESYVCRDELWSIFEECWNRNPNLRPSADQLVQRLWPLVRQLGKKNENTEQKPPQPQRGPSAPEDGKATLPAVEVPPKKD